MKFEIIKADLIQEALGGMFDVIAHGCNCFCVQEAGISAQMVKHFNTDNAVIFEFEQSGTKGNVNKLGIIDYGAWDFEKDKLISKYAPYLGIPNVKVLYIVNAYTQYEPGKNLDYEALTLCMRKINHEFKGKDIGLPWIGCGIAGGDKVRVKQILRQELKDCNVTICEL